MRDRRGRALYVGKAADLRRRVRSYFGPGGRHGRLIGRALEQLDSIDHEVCGSEFAALLRENDLIKAAQPAVQPARRRRGRALPQDQLRARWRPGSTWCRGCSPTARPTSARSAPSGWRARPSSACTPCTRSPPRTPRPATRPWPRSRSCSGATPPPSAGWALRIAQAVADGRLDFDPSEADGPAESVLGLLGALARVRRARRRAAVIVEPRRDGRAEAFFVAGGIVRSRADIAPDDWRDAARVGLDALRRAARRPAALAPDALDEVTIVEGRLLDGAATGSALRLPAGWRTAVALAWIEGAVARVCSTSAAPGG